MPNQKRLKELTTLIGLQNAVGGNDREMAMREHQSRVAAAMQILGLQQQQVAAAQSNALQQQQMQQSASQFDQTQQEHVATRKQNDTNANREVQIAGLHSLEGNPQNSDLLKKYLGLIDPTFSPLVNQGDEKDATIKRLNDMLTAVGVNGAKARMNQPTYQPGPVPLPTPSPYSPFESPDAAMSRYNYEGATGQRLTADGLTQQKADARSRAEAKLKTLYGIQ